MISVADVVVVFPLLNLFEFLILVGVGEDVTIGFPDWWFPVGRIACDGWIFSKRVHDNRFFHWMDRKDAFQDLGDTGETGGKVEVDNFAIWTFFGAGRIVGVGNEDLGVMASSAKNS